MDIKIKKRGLSLFHDDIFHTLPLYGAYGGIFFEDRLHDIVTPGNLVPYAPRSFRCAPPLSGIVGILEFYSNTPFTR